MIQKLVQKPSDGGWVAESSVSLPFLNMEHRDTWLCPLSHQGVPYMDPQTSVCIPLIWANSWGAEGSGRGDEERDWERSGVTSSRQRASSCWFSFTNSSEDISAVGTVRWSPVEGGCRSCEWLWSVWLLQQPKPSRTEKQRLAPGKEGGPFFFFKNFQSL